MVQNLILEPARESHLHEYKGGGKRSLLQLHYSGCNAGCVWIKKWKEMAGKKEKN